MAITDLTGTKWLFNEEIYTAWWDIQEYGNNWRSDITFISNETTYNSMRFAFFPVDIENVLGYGDSTTVYDYVGIDEEGGWKNEAYRTIEITGGTDATNTDLINWLQENATQIIEPTGNTYTLTHTLTNLTKGNITLQITPDTGYTYPTSLTITNGTLVSYDNTTGIAVINGDDTTIVSGECVEQASGYSGNITSFFHIVTSGINTATKIKFDTAPTSGNDYDSYVTENGILTGLTSYQNKTKIYIWGDAEDSAVRVNGTIYSGSNLYFQAVEVSLTGNYTIELAYGVGSGSGSGGAD